MSQHEQQIPDTAIDTTPQPLRRPALRAAIRRAIARQASQANAANAPIVPSPPEPVMPEATRSQDTVSSRRERPFQPAPPREQQRFRAAAVRAATRVRSEIPPLERELRPTSAASLGRARTQARARFNSRALQHAQLQGPALADAAIAQPLVASHTPAPAQPRRQPLPPEVIAALTPDAPAPPELRRPPLVLAVGAGGLWAGTGVWLLFGALGPQASLNTRLAFGGLLVALGLLTWGPLQWATRLKVLTWRGTVGWGMLLWTLAFVPPPTAPLVAGLPDLPVYALLFGSVFLAGNALALPVLYVRSLHRTHARTVRLDLRQPKRQAAECGLFLSLCFALAAINALTLVSVILMLAILVLSEMMILFWEQ